MTTSTRLPLGGVLAETFHRFRKDFFDSYRPERHYMRGPGPKWREKYQTNAAGYAAPSLNPGSRA